jgi:NDP-sugar pyrophosphorylase family protein
MPLTRLRPKPLCPVNNITLLDRALELVGRVATADAIAVNAHHLAAQIEAHVAGRHYVSLEQPEALGTAGAVGAVAGWLAGRDVLIANGDAFVHPSPDVERFVEEWDRKRPRLLVVADAERPDFDGQWRFAGMSLLPAAAAARLPAVPAGLYEAVWRTCDLDLVRTDSSFIDCGEPASYLSANLMASNGKSVVGAGAVVHGEVERCVVWSDAQVHPGERLVECIRARDLDGTDLTVRVSAF